jgi:hypothetical protein
MFARSLKEVEQVWTTVDGVRKVSDRIVGLGPFGIGLDGIIAMLASTGVGAAPGVVLDELYTWGAGGFLLWQALRVRASSWTVTRMVGYLLLDTLAGGLSAIPLVGGLVDLLFQGHLYAARALQKDIERTHWVESGWREARASGELNRHYVEAKAQRKRRVVFLYA